jgi:uncharacterized OsmC-like protein
MTVTRRKSVRAAQEMLSTMYTLAPDMARVSSHASTVDHDPADPFRATVFIGAGDADLVPFAAERALGGQAGMPTPTDFLCAALAASLDSSMRMAANRWDVIIETLNVEVRGWGDVHGAVRLSGDVPMGLEGLECTVRLKTAEGTDPERVRRMLIEAEQCCIVLATLRRSVPVYSRVEWTASNRATLTTS